MIVVPFGYTGPGPVAVEGIEVLDRELGALR
jgi:iron complex transport system substrate-binding protein